MRSGEAIRSPAEGADASGPPGPEGLTGRVRALAPLIAGHAAQAEADRKPVDAVIEALERTSVFRSFVPRRFGGYEIDNASFIDIGGENYGRLLLGMDPASPV